MYSYVNESDLALILGLSLGLGIPVLLLSIGGVYYFVKRSKTPDDDISGISMSSKGEKNESGSDETDDDNAF